VVQRILHLAFVGVFAISQSAAIAAPAPQATAAAAIEAVPGLSQFAPFAAAAKRRAQADDGAYRVLRDYVQVADASGAVQIPSRDQAKGGAVGDAYSALQNFLKSGDAPMASAKAPASAADDYSVVQAFAGDKTEAKPIVLAANESKKASKEPIAIKDIERAVYVGSQACVKCHRNQFGSFAATLHGDIFLKQPRNIKEKEGCEACHGPASKHVVSKEMDGGAAGDIISFRKDSPRPIADRNAVCLTCHERGDRTYWNGSTHETRGAACTDCHQIMEKVSVKHQLVKSTEAEVCFQCHKDRRAQFAKTNHMPVGNGAMTCSSCHNPHGSATDKLLREASVNEVCYKCHADKRGPYLWEHEPVRDSCLNCHEAHGTVNEYMLKVQRPRLCQLCHQGGLGHGIPGNPNTIQAINRSCQNCHTKVHGSNSPAGQLLQR
jgi:DmsE family decaheme c-type cytochrome